MQKTLYVGLDVHKVSISVTVAEEGREGAVSFIGTIPNSPIALTKLPKRLGKDGHRLEFCYEAGCCGYGIYRHLTALGHACTVFGCGQLLMFWKGGNAILVEFLPELVPPAFGEDEGSQAEDDLSALWRPAHPRTTQPLFDQSFACGLCDA